MKNFCFIDPVSTMLIGTASKSLLGGKGLSPAKIVGNVVGGTQVISGMMKKRKANAMRPPMEDVEQRELVNEMRRIANSGLSGTYFQTALGEIDKQAAELRSGLTSASGGSSGGLVSSLLRGTKEISSSKNQVLSAGQEQQRYYQGLRSQLIDKIASRKLDLQMYDRSRLFAEAAQNTQTGMQNVLASLAMGGGGGEKDYKPLHQANTQQVQDNPLLYPKQQGGIMYSDFGTPETGGLDPEALRSLGLIK